MCGLAGFLHAARQMGVDEMRYTVSKMTETLSRRGPDDEGCWVDPEAGVALGHRRLAVIDLTAEGRQPMTSVGGRYVIVFNGEIYNFPALRQELKTVNFRGRSDTEVLLAAVESWGMTEAVKRCIGMFAFALWDKEQRKLYLVRDRIGEKPLYYGWMGTDLLFGSELKAFRRHPRFTGRINRQALALYTRHGYVPAPHSIYEGVYKLLPGTILTVGAGTDPKPEPIPYWCARQAFEAGTVQPFSGTGTEAVEELDQLLRSAVKQQMISDVPLGAFLSGGVDSSTVVALMQTQSGMPVKSFSIGFLEAEYNEAEYALQVARHLGTDHTELYVTPQMAMGVIPRLPELYDEPFADPSQIPTFLLAELARQKVTVSLSGDAGDELFGGYDRYFRGRRIWNRIRWMPRFFRRANSAALRLASPAAWDRAFKGIAPCLPDGLSRRLNGDKVHSLAEMLMAENPGQVYQYIVSHWKEPSDMVNTPEPSYYLNDPGKWADLSDFCQLMMYLDLVTYLPDDILVKVDRACMGVSLESRAPFLDHRVVEFALRLPLDLKMRGERGKWLLRQVLYRYVPREIIDRPKMGFALPVDSWLRGPLRGWAEDLLDGGRLRDEGYFNPALVRGKWKEHLEGSRDWQFHLWDVLMFQAWLDTQKTAG